MRCAKAILVHWSFTPNAWTRTAFPVKHIAGSSRTICAINILVVSGKLNKQIGCEVGTGDRTIKAHRANIVDKAGVQSIVDLVRVTQDLGIEPIR